ncbi:MAG: TIM barrel protein [Candidatus Hinthialibacter antarcticus]|nr:TIM barrel protein [Candidatus Hinthialibacter antarcticus]
MSAKNSISRRSFVALSAVAATAFAPEKARAQESVRLGGPVFESYNSPEEWTKAVKALGYSAAYCPVGADAGDALIAEYKQAAHEADITIAEVGAWSNPIDPDSKKRAAAIDKCKTQLELAEKIGARCCVNISGSLNPEKWDSHHPKNLRSATLNLIIKTTREIIDAVNPQVTYFTLETMPWAIPDSTESYMTLLERMKRDRFAAHYDPVNIINSPRRYYNNAKIISDAFSAFGNQIRSCHAKDIKMSDAFTVHLDEVRPGLGNLDYGVFLKELSRYPDAPLMLEHLPNAEEYKQAADYVRAKADEVGVALHG